MIPYLPSIVEVLGATVAVIGALAVLRKKVWQPTVAFLGEVSKAIKSLNGYEEVTDPGSGTILKQATPPLSKRVENVEAAVLLLTDVQERQSTLEQQMMEHLKFSEEWVTLTEQRLDALENL